jgi:hypothetical protein
VGRAGIRRRKKKSHVVTPDQGDTGIIADLEDQAAGSSYAQDIPRLGNPRRQAIWWGRYLRMMGHVKRGDGFDREWRDSARNATIIAFFFLLTVSSLVALVWWLRS